MITTSTGAKKLESSDNWREIFPNPGTSAAGAHNASVDAHDRIQAEVAPIINGKRCSLGAASGEYVLLRNSTITGKADGAYQAAKAIPANTDLDSTYLGSAITGGLVNELNNKIIEKDRIIEVHTDGIATAGGTKDIDYPSGFNQSNCVVLCSYANLYESKYFEGASSVTLKRTKITLTLSGGSAGQTGAVYALLYKPY